MKFRPTSLLPISFRALLVFAALAVGATAAETIRIRAGVSTPLKDETGVTWLGDRGFEDGDTMDRAGLKIANTPIPSLYWAERFGMTKFTHALPNGKYTVKLHFAITYEGINGPGEVVFSMNVEGTMVKNLDIWAKAGGGQRAYIETVPVTIADGKLDITFIAQGENPTISGIEIIPVP